MLKPKSVTRLILLYFSVISAAFALESPQFKGNWVQGGVLVGKTEPRTTIEFNGRNVPVSEDGVFVVGLAREAESPAVLIAKNDQGMSVKFEYPVKERKFNIQDIKGVPQRTVTPDPEQVARAKREAQLTNQARATTLDATHYAHGFEWPLLGRISGVYGSQRIYNGVPGSPHWGVDIARPTGTLVKAPAKGVVTLVHPDMFYSGGTLIVDHGHRLSSTFIHLSEILVNEGDLVEQGDPIAKVGATGRATGPHLDWRMNWFEIRVDPTTLVGPMPKQ